MRKKPVNLLASITSPSSFSFPVVVAAATELLGTVQDLEVDDGIDSPGLLRVDMVSHAPEDLIEDLLAGGAIDDFGDLLVRGLGDEPREVVRIDLVEVGHGLG